MKEYVVGLAFNKAGNRLLLIEKQKPEFLKGKWNGLGGSVEEGETYHEAIAREVHEEAGILISPSKWEEFAHVESHYQGKLFGKVVYLKTFTDEILAAKTMETEKIAVESVENALNYLVMPQNLHWMIPLCFDMELNTPIDLIWHRNIDLIWHRN